MTDRSFDVLVVGGGLAGLAFGGLLARRLGGRRPEITIGILENRPPPPLADDSPAGLRVLAIAPAARGILMECNAWQALPSSRSQAFARMCAWQSGDSPDGRRRILFEAADLGLPALGYIVEHDWLRLALWRALEDEATSRRITFLAPGTPARIERGAQRATIVMEDGAVVSARLLIGADGADSFVRAALSPRTMGHSYGQTALVAHVSSERSHQATAWQCFGAGGPVALLPLADGRSSIVWSCPKALADELMHRDEAGFAARLTEATGRVLGDLRLTTGRAAFPLAARHARRYTGPRFALIGDAAHQIHPLAGQGINLGFLDAAALAETLALHLAATGFADPGDALVLRRYERARKGANLLSLATMETLHRLFTGSWPGVADLAGIGLGVVDRLGPLKRLLGRQATGYPFAPGGHEHHADL